jgi:hypothetical protein
LPITSISASIAATIKLNRVRTCVLNRLHGVHRLRDAFGFHLHTAPVLGTRSTRYQHPVIEVDDGQVRGLAHVYTEGTDLDFGAAALVGIKAITGGNDIVR